MFTWPLVVLVLGLVAALLVRHWIDQKTEMEREHHRFQHRAFAMEERKFEVWKTSQYAHASQLGKAAEGVIKTAMRDTSPQILPGGMDMEPQPGKVVSLHPHGPFKGQKVLSKRSPKILRGSVPELSEAELVRITELLDKAKDMPEDEARKFLQENGLQQVEFED